MSANDICIYGDLVLRRKAEQVDTFDDNLKQTADEMFEAMFEADGVGLAAPQVGISKAFLVMGMPRDNDEPEQLFFANPEILETRGESTFEEGCLSIPGIREDVVRSEWIRVRYQDLEGQVHELEADGLLARALQHEIDHLNGILFIDRLSPARRGLLKNSLEKLAKSSGQLKYTEYAGLIKM
jgi:peptide deformylase